MGFRETVLAIVIGSAPLIWLVGIESANIQKAIRDSAEEIGVHLEPIDMIKADLNSLVVEQRRRRQQFSESLMPEA